MSNTLASLILFIFSDLSEKSPSAYDKNLEESFAWEA